MLRQYRSSSRTPSASKGYVRRIAHRPLYGRQIADLQALGNHHRSTPRGNPPPTSEQGPRFRLHRGLQQLGKSNQRADRTRGMDQSSDADVHPRLQGLYPGSPCERGQYRTINADVVYEGEVRKVNKITGEIAFDGEKTSDKIIGYFCYFEAAQRLFQDALCNRRGYGRLRQAVFSLREERDDRRAGSSPKPTTASSARKSDGRATSTTWL